MPKPTAFDLARHALEGLAGDAEVLWSELQCAHHRVPVCVGEF